MNHYTVKDGLPTGTIYSMLNDSKGFLWFGTDAGVSRFDGHKFTNFTLSEGLSDNEVLKIAEDSKGRIWFLGLSGTLCYYNNGKFFSPSNDTILKKAKINNTYFFFFEDNVHRLWFSSNTGYTIIDKDKVEIVDAPKNQIRQEGTVFNLSNGDIGILAPAFSGVNDSTGGLFTYKNNKFTKSRIRYNKQFRSRFCYTHDGSILFVSPEGIILQKDTVQKVIIPPAGQFENSKILGLNLSSDCLLWVETIDKGVYCYDYDNLSLAPKRYLKNKGVADIIEDKEHNIWIATFGDGVYMLPACYKAVNNYYCENYEKHYVYCVAKDKAGDIYTGHDDLVVNVLKAGKSTQLFFQNQKKGFGYNRVDKLLIEDNNLWIGTDVDLTHITTHNSYNSVAEVLRATAQIHNLPDIFGPVRYIKDICLYNNNIMVCTNNAILFSDTTRRSNDTLIQIDKVGKRHYCVYADKNGIIWYGVSDGLYSYNGKEEINHASESSYLTNSIYDINETNDSVLILASYGNGVFFYKNGKVLIHLTENDGISSNLCKKVFVHNNEIFLSTPKGATRISYSHRHIDSIKVFTTKNGLVSNNVNDVYADDSEICFATTEGLTVLNTRVAEIKTEAPLVYLTAIKSKDQVLAPDSNYTFSHDQNSIQFSFTGISYRLPDDMLYQYRLTEDQKWMETKNTSIDIPYLAPGSYHFQLRARILNGPWSDIRSFYFTIKSPFWKTIWFAMLCALSFILLVIFIAMYQAIIRKRKEATQLKIKDQVTYLEQQALQAMMNPHFIFNVMNSIQYYINNNEKHEANLYLADFARLIRMNLDISSKRYIPLDEEVAYLELYMNLERLRFGKNLTYKIEVEQGIDGDETMVPVMLLQPFIENAIWHGILPKKEPGHVQVDIKKEKDGMLKIIITDNGIGIPGTKDPVVAGVKTYVSRGMKMTQQRLDLLSKITGHTLYFHIHNAFPGEYYKGTKVEFLLPGDLS